MLLYPYLSSFLTTTAIDFAQPSIHYTGILGIMFHETHNQVSLYILYFVCVFAHSHPCFQCNLL